MSLLLSEEQKLLKQSAADFVHNESPVSRIRELRDSADPRGFSPELWRKMAELGWQAVPFAEEYGGLGMGMTEMATVLEECGRNLVPEPLLATVLLGAMPVSLAGSDEQRRAVLPAVVDGSLVMALAYQEKGSRYDPLVCRTTAARSGDGYVLDGEKILVAGGHAASKLVVSARSAEGYADPDGISLFLVDPETPGMTVEGQATMHLRNAALVRFDGAEVPAAALLGAEGEGAAVLEQTVDLATLGTAAEMLGGMQAAFDMTLDHLKTREQFGVPIGSFQGLKHRAAKMFIEIELARSAVIGACAAVDKEYGTKASQMISVAKARCSDAGVLVGYESVQMHGGIGMTDEHDIGFYLKRARGLELTMGDGAHHRDRYARIEGF